MANSPLGVAFDDPEAQNAELADYYNKLGVALPGYVHTYKPGWDAQLTAQAEAERNPLIFAPAVRESVETAGKLMTGEIPLASSEQVQDRLFGFHGAGKRPDIRAPAPVEYGERYQTWPEQIVRSGGSLPHDVYTGEQPVIDPVTGRTSQSLIERTQDLAGMAGGGFAAKPNAAVAAAKSSELAPLSALERAPRFYSALENAVKDSGTKVASAEQWLGELRNKPGVKQEELDWVLHDLPTGKITKSELEKYVQEHKVELKEVNNSDSNYYELRYKDSLPFRMRDWSDLPINDETDVMTARRHNPNFAASTQGKSSSQVLKALEEAKNIPDLPRSFFKKYDTREEALAAIKESGAEEHIEEPLMRTDRKETKYSQWQLPGGENYREHLLTLPIAHNEFGKLLNQFDAKYGENNWTFNKLPEAERNLYREAQGNSRARESFKSSHFDEPNILAHMRTNERTIPGVGNSLHVEEIQSDWHQAGRKQGYKGEREKLKSKFDEVDNKIMKSEDESIMADPDLDSALNTAIKKGIITKEDANIYKRYSQIEAAQEISEHAAVPDAPFKSNWPDLALKRVIRQAAEEGKDSISWTPGEAQALRYQNDIRQKLNSVEWHDKQMGKPSPDGSKTVLVTPSHGNEISLTVDKNGTIASGRRELKGKKLDTVLGKDIASKILGDAEGSIDAKGYVMNSESMKAFYDKMLVDKANAIAKKFGGKVEKGNLQYHNGDDYSIIESGKDFVVKGGDHNYGFFKTREEAENKVSELKSKDEARNPSIHVLRITPQLRDAALNKGFSLFADTGKVGAPLAALTRVEHNPFTTDAYHGSPGPLKGDRIKPMGGIVIGHDGTGYTVSDIDKVIQRGLQTKEAAHDWIDKKALADFYSTSNPKLAEDYARQNRHGVGQNITPLKIDTRDYHTVDAKGKPWDAVNQFAINEANQLAKKGVIVKNVLDDADPLNNSRGPQTVYITLDPSTVRSKFAKFDPKKFGESGLLKTGSLPIYSDENGNQLMPPPVNPSKIDLPTLQKWATERGIKITPIEGNPFK